MGEVKHTPGPWMVAPEFGESHGQFSILDADGAEVGSAEAWIGQDRPEAVANACLIAAAPELLAFVQAVARHNPVFAKGVEKDRIREARVLVAKATGEQP